MKYLRAADMWLAARWISGAYAWACARLYSDAAFTYDSVSWLVSAGRWGQWRELALAYVSGIRVLELGFGTGHLLSVLARRGLVVAGLDASPQMARLARKRLARSAAHATLVQGRGQAMPWPDASFDTIVTTFPADYIVEAHTLAECARVLRLPGGRLVISGLWVALPNMRLAQLWPVFYGVPEPSLIQDLCERLTQLGFAPRIIERRCAWASVGIVVADLIVSRSSARIL